MKKRDLESMLYQMGFRLIRSKKHDAWSNGSKTVFTPRHKVVNIFLAKKILASVQ
jgi:hypothetical protein